MATVDDIIANSDAFKLAYQKAVSQIEKIRKWVEEAEANPFVPPPQIPDGMLPKLK